MPLRPTFSTPPRVPSAGRWSGLVATALMLAASGCASDAVIAPPPTMDVAQMYWALTLDHHAVTLSTVAPYDTIRLTATPRTASGEPLAGLPAPAFTSTDLERVQVDSTGLVHTRGTGSRIAVVATLSLGNLVHTDTVLITVTSSATPPVLTSFSIHPTPPDSAKTAQYTYKVLVARAPDSTGASISGLSAYYSSLDPTTATIDRSTGRVTPVRPGPVTFVASATAYGIMKADTLPFTIGYPVALGTTATAQTAKNGQVTYRFVPDRLELGLGGTVSFVNQTGVPADVTFDDPADVAQGTGQFCAPPWSIFFPNRCLGSGNIEAFAATADGHNTARARSFPVPGTYTFHSARFGTTGTIVVIDERTQTP